MTSVFRNAHIEIFLNRKFFSYYLKYPRCISKISETTNYYFLKINETSVKPLEFYKNSRLSRQQFIKQYSTSTSTDELKDKSETFSAYFPGIVQELKEKAEKYTGFGVGDHLERVLNYNIPGGKNIRGASVMNAYELLLPKDSVTEENLKLAGYLGWCNEMLHASVLMFDDVMDRSITRRGRVCWYKLEDIKLSAINDSFMIKAGIYHILKEHFSHLKGYTKLLELFNDMCFIAFLAQYLDVKSLQLDVLSFTMEQYKTIAIHKTGSGYYLTIASALHLAGYTSPDIFQEAKEILFDIGLFFQIQDDFIDCFGDPKLTGKIGTDIQDGKCTWLSVMCVQRATDAQKEIMKECYGKDDTEAVMRIKQLYEELCLPDIYASYEEEFYKRIKSQIDQISQKIPAEIFIFILDKIFKRNL